MNVLSVLFGIVALLIALVGLFPLIGILNWLAIPFAVIGLVLSFFTERRSGRNLNAVALILAIVRLFLGGGIL